MKRTAKLFGIIILAALIGFSIAACGKAGDPSSPGDGEFTAVTSITGVSTAGTVGQLTLTGTVNPSGATNKTIVWSVVNAGTTGASISGSTLTTTAAGTVKVRVTITNGTAAGTNYTQDFNIVISAEGDGLNLKDTTWTDEDSDTELSFTDSNYSMKVDGAEISKGTYEISDNEVTLIPDDGSDPIILTVTDETTITIHGSGTTFNKNEGDFVAVMSITSVPTAGIAGSPLTLSGTVNPSNATRKTIVWSLLDAGTTGVSNTGNILNPTAAGTIKVRATIINGTAKGIDFTDDFTITISAKDEGSDNIVAVTSITGVSTSALTAGLVRTLNGTVNPSNATNKTIIWSIEDAGTTGASVSANRLTATAAGTVVVRATIVNGSAAGTNYTQDFNITVNYNAVTSISRVSTTGTAGTQHYLTGTVNPSNASYKTIVWSIEDAGTTGATLSGDELNTTTAGTVKIRATIKNGTAVGVDYTQDFNISISYIPVDSISITSDILWWDRDYIDWTVNPSNASYKTIVWSLEDAGTTGANISFNTISTTSEGTVKVRATIENGTAVGTNYTQDFDIKIVIPVHVSKEGGEQNVPFNSLSSALNSTTAPGNYTVRVNDGMRLFSNYPITGEGRKITLTAQEPVTIEVAQHNSGLSLFTVGDGATLILGNNITLQGVQNYDRKFITIEDGGEFILEGGTITGSNVYALTGIIVGSNGIFTMIDGKISGNKSVGVNINSNGTFNMKGGTISDGVRVDSNGTFNMEGGTISGGGVYVGSYGTFNMAEGLITSCSVTVDINADFTMEGGVISGNTANYGGGVYVAGTFTMIDGKITGNTTLYSSAYTYGGGGVYVVGTFTMKGGEISGNIGGNTGGGVYVDHDKNLNKSGTFIMEDGLITGNTADSAGGGVRVFVNCSFIMKGGEISDNSTISTSTITGIGGGGVYAQGSFVMEGGKITNNRTNFIGGGVLASGTFSKTDGTITGYSSDPVNGNIVKNISGTINNYGGHAVYITTSKRRETTVGPLMILDSTKDGAAGGWVE